MIQTLSPVPTFCGTQNDGALVGDSRPAYKSDEADGSSNASGWVGRDLLSVSLRDSGDATDLNGFLGGRFVNLRQTAHGNFTNIFGTVSGNGGTRFVNVTVTSVGNGASWYTGSIGHEPVNLNTSG